MHILSCLSLSLDRRGGCGDGCGCVAGWLLDRGLHGCVDNKPAAAQEDACARTRKPRDKVRSATKRPIGASDRLSDQVAEWSKASGLGPDLFVGVGSNPTADISFFVFAISLKIQG